MSHRTQVILSDAQYSRLKQESQRTGVGLAELVRRAVAVVYGVSGAQQVDEALEQSFGAWKDYDLDGEAYVEHLRRGLGQRLAR
jgi:predicted DNA-binding protein